MSENDDLMSAIIRILHCVETLKRQLMVRWKIVCVWFIGVCERIEQPLREEVDLGWGAFAWENSGQMR